MHVKLTSQTQPWKLFPNSHHFKCLLLCHFNRESIHLLKPTNWPQELVQLALQGSHVWTHEVICSSNWQRCHYCLESFRLGDSMSAQKATTSGLYRQKPPRPTHQKKGANTTGPLGTWAHTEQAWISHPNLNLSDPSTQSLGESGNGCLPHCSVAVQTTTTTTPPFLHHHHVSDRICVCWVRRSLL